MSTSPIPQPQPGSPRAQLQAAVVDLVGRLVDPASTRESLHDSAAEVDRLHRTVGEPDVPLSLHIRELLQDLERGMPSGAYYSVRLQQAADRL